MYDPKQVTIRFEISTDPKMTCEQLTKVIETTKDELVRMISQKVLSQPGSHSTTTSAEVYVQVAEME